MSSVKVNINDLLAKAAAAAEAAKTGFHSLEWRVNSLKDGDSVDLKLLLPANGGFFAETIHVEMGEGKSFRSYFSKNFPVSEDGNCPLVDAVNQLKMSAEAKKFKPLLDKVATKKYFYVPALVLDINVDDTGAVSGYKALDNEVKYLRLTPNQFIDVQSVMKDKYAQNAGNGIFDRMLGRTITLTRTGSSKTDTKYKFSLGGVPVSIAEEVFYTNDCDPVEYVKSQIKTDEELTDVFVQFFK